MKSCTKSSIQTCQARLPFGDGSFLFGLAGLGEGLASGVGVISAGLGEGVAGITVGVAAGGVGTIGKTVGLGDGAAVCCGAGATGVTTSVFFCERHSQSAARRPSTRTIAPMTTGPRFTGDRCPAETARCFNATLADGG